MKPQDMNKKPTVRSLCNIDSTSSPTKPAWRKTKRYRNFGGGGGGISVINKYLQFNSSYMADQEAGIKINNNEKNWHTAINKHNKQWK